MSPSSTSCWRTDAQPDCSAASSRHCALVRAVPSPGLIPASIAGARYFLIVLRSTPRLVAISLNERPAHQWVKISRTSVTSNVLLAISLPGNTTPTWADFILRGPTTRRDTLGNYVSENPQTWGIS